MGEKVKKGALHANGSPQPELCCVIPITLTITITVESTITITNTITIAITITLHANRPPQPDPNCIAYYIEHYHFTKYQKRIIAWYNTNGPPRTKSLCCVIAITLTI